MTGVLLALVVTLTSADGGAALELDGAASLTLFVQADAGLGGPIAAVGGVVDVGVKRSFSGVARGEARLRLELAPFSTVPIRDLGSSLSVSAEFPRAWNVRIDLFPVSGALVRPFSEWALALPIDSDLSPTARVSASREDWTLWGAVCFAVPRGLAAQLGAPRPALVSGLLGVVLRSAKRVQLEVTAASLSTEVPVPSATLAPITLRTATLTASVLVHAVDGVEPAFDFLTYQADPQRFVPSLGAARGSSDGDLTFSAEAIGLATSTGEPARLGGAVDLQARARWKASYFHLVGRVRHPDAIARANLLVLLGGDAPIQQVTPTSGELTAIAVFEQLLGPVRLGILGRLRLPAVWEARGPLGDHYFAMSPFGLVQVGSNRVVPSAQLSVRVMPAAWLAAVVWADAEVSPFVLVQRNRAVLDPRLTLRAGLTSVIRF